MCKGVARCNQLVTGLPPEMGAMPHLEFTERCVLAWAVT